MQQLHKHWGERIRNERKLRGWSQSDLAWALEVTKSCVNHMESGRVGFSEKRKIELASAFGLTVPLLFTYPDPLFYKQDRK